MKKYLYKSRSIFCLATTIYCLGHLGAAYAVDNVLDSTYLTPPTLSPDRTQVTLEGGPFTSDMILCIPGKPSKSTCTVPLKNVNTHCPVGYKLVPIPIMTIINWYNPGNCFVEGFDLAGIVLDTGNGYVIQLSAAYGETGAGCDSDTYVQFSAVVYCNPD